MSGGGNFGGRATKYLELTVRGANSFSLNSKSPRSSKRKMIPNCIKNVAAQSSRRNVSAREHRMTSNWQSRALRISKPRYESQIYFLLHLYDTLYFKRLLLSSLFRILSLPVWKLERGNYLCSKFVCAAVLYK